MTTALTGSQEYAATLALYDFHTSGAYDLIVLDTPPTANALDFLDAPHRIAEAVSSPVVSWFARSGEKAGRFSLRRLRLGRGADPAAAGQVRRQPVPRRPGRVPGGLPGRAGRLPRARPGHRRPAAPAGRRLPAGAGARAAGGGRGAVFPRAPARGRVLAGRLRRQPGAAGTGTGGGRRLRRETAQLPGLAAMATRTTGRRRARAGRDRRRSWPGPPRRSGTSWPGCTNGIPEVPLLEIPLLPREPASAQSLRIIGDRLAGPAVARAGVTDRRDRLGGGLLRTGWLGGFAARRSG